MFYICLSNESKKGTLISYSTDDPVRFIQGFWYFKRVTQWATVRVELTINS